MLVTPLELKLVQKQEAVNAGPGAPVRPVICVLLIIIHPLPVLVLDIVRQKPPVPAMVNAITTAFVNASQVS